MKKSESMIGLLEVLVKAGQADLDEIQKEKATLQARMDLLSEAEKLLTIKIHGRPQRKSPGPRKGGKPAGDKAAPPAKDAELSSREKIGKLLAKNGAMRPVVIAENLKITPATVYNAVGEHAWFTKVAEGIALTTAGKNVFCED